MRGLELRVAPQVRHLLHGLFLAPFRAKEHPLLKHLAFERDENPVGVRLHRRIAAHWNLPCVCRSRGDGKGPRTLPAPRLRRWRSESVVELAGIDAALAGVVLDTGSDEPRFAVE